MQRRLVGEGRDLPWCVWVCAERRGAAKRGCEMMKRERGGECEEKKKWRKEMIRDPWKLGGRGRRHEREVAGAEETFLYKETREEWIQGWI